MQVDALRQSPMPLARRRAIALLERGASEHRRASSSFRVQCSARSSHGQRSASSSGMPAAIFATFAAGWYSSASMKRQPSACASASPMVVLPAPETPITHDDHSARFWTAWPPKPRAHHGEQPPRVVRAALAREAAHQRERDHRRGHAELDRFERGPAAFAGVGHHRRDARRASSLSSRISAQRSSSHERTTLPWRQVSARRADVDVELGARGEQREAFGERLHHPVLDAVVDHLGEVAGAARPAMQPAALGTRARACARTARRSRSISACRRASGSSRCSQPVDAARDAGVDVAQALLRQRERAALRVAVVAVAAVDDACRRRSISGSRLADRVLDRVARGQR